MKSDALISLLAVVAIGVVTFFIFPRPNANSPVISELSNTPESALSENSVPSTQLTSTTATGAVAEFLEIFLSFASASPDPDLTARAHALLSTQLQQTTPATNPRFAQTILEYLDLPFMPQDAELLQTSELSNNSSAVTLEFLYQDGTSTTRTITVEENENSWVITNFSQD